MINCEDMSGIGGSVETYVIDGALILFGEYAIEMPVFVIKHPHPIDHRRPHTQKPPDTRKAPPPKLVMHHSHALWAVICNL